MKSNNNTIFIDSNIPFLPDAVKEYGDVRLFKGRSLTNDDLTNVELANQPCKWLFLRSTVKANKALLDGTQVEFVSTATSGDDHFDIGYLDRHNITHSAARGSNANSVAEYVVYSILKWCGMNNSLPAGKTIGVIGYGCVGSIVAEYCHRLGMTVLVNDPPLAANGFRFSSKFKYATFGDILVLSDVVTNHVPLTNKESEYPTCKLFNKSNLYLLKSNSLFIHASRGRVVDEASLLRMINDKSISVVVDVWENEPQINAELVLRAIHASPHVAGHSYQGKIRGSLMVARAWEDFTKLKADLTMINSELSTYSPLPLEYYSNPQKLMEILAENRQFQSDFDRFLKLTDLPIEIQRKEFDLLRSNYPRRNETL